MGKNDDYAEAAYLKDVFDEGLNDWWDENHPDPELVERAKSIAHRAHEGQTDKAGAPYIDHPLRVAQNARILARSLFPDVDENLVTIVALLHDVVEDCPDWTPARLKSEGMTKSIIDFVDAVTHQEGEERRAYLERIVAAGLIPTLVKAADLADNSDPARIAVLPRDVQAKMMEKYRPDKVFIRDALLSMVR